MKHCTASIKQSLGGMVRPMELNILSRLDGSFVTLCLIFKSLMGLFSECLYLGHRHWPLLGDR